MKLAAIKIGARIAWGNKDTSAGSGEAKSVINMLRLAGCEVDIYTKVLPKDRNPNLYKFYNIEDEYVNINTRGYEGLVVLNGNVNFFGGAESKDQILNYWLINNYPGRVFYIYCDPALQLTQVWPAIKNKSWASNWNQSDIEIKRTDIIYISQPYTLDDVKVITDKSGIIPEKIIHYPMEQFPCLNPIVEMKENPTMDLSYGGTMRGGKRIKKMAKFYFNYSDDIKVEMFGKIDIDDIQKTADKMFSPGAKAPVGGPPVNYVEFSQKMNDTLTHIVIGDPWYEGRDMPQRCYESIYSNVVTFIDIELDPLKRVYGSNPVCSAFNYVTDQADAEKKIRALKEDPSKRKFILEQQFKAVGFNPDAYCGGLVEILKANSTGSVKIGEAKYFEPIKTKPEFEDEEDEVIEVKPVVQSTGTLF